ncbi:MAG: hypothetical protein M1838_001902 [Thelocarpon superellum]|nr:MAG: hypothetical protein M1838_001902 [Thelocarpon superellum]
MESQSLHTASLYINNLLLARGLLRNGTPIEFATPSKADGGSEATMAKIINLVHDLVLRRDREAEQREHLAQTIHTLRRGESKQTLEMERLQARQADCQRQLAIAQGQERAFKATLRTAEHAARGLREEMLRLKTMLQHVRTQCANDLRKRDVQIQRLKSHLTTQQRGTRPPLTTSTITITPTHPAHLAQLARDEAGVPIDSPDYALTQETTEFLTQLSQNLSNENDNLIGLVRSTLVTLRALQGLSAHPARAAPLLGENGDGVDHAVSSSNVSHSGSSLLEALPTSYDALATDMDDVLEHLRTLLTNPSFVPLEEVEVREEEIHRLREGWEKMEGRWREAVQMMEGWRKRMARGGHGVNLEELRIGLSLSPLKAEKVVVAAAGEQPVEAVEEADSHSSDHGEESDGDGDGDGDSDSDEALGIGLRPDGAVLADADQNIRPRAALRRPAIHPITEENTQDGANGTSASNVALVDVSGSKSEQAGGLSERPSSKHGESKIPRQASKRVMSSGPSGPVEKRAKLSRPTVQQKLDGARAEAQKAEQRKALAGAARRKTNIRGPAKKTRRRSTLTEEELDSLIQGRVSH